MILVGQRITKISGERKHLDKGTVIKNISSNAVPLNIREEKTADAKKKFLVIEWEFVSNYELEKDERLAELKIAGELIYDVEAKDFKEIMDEWKKSKSVSKEKLLVILQTVLNIGQVEGIILAKNLNLPSPVQLLRIQEK